ncbi:hypothetical protein BH20ACT6_BH20ACT6_07510 [soil metagenome]
MSSLAFQGGVDEALRAAATARANADEMSVPAIGLRRSVARRLADERFTTADIAALLGVSYGRALQLVGPGSRAGAAGAGERSRQRPVASVAGTAGQHRQGAKPVSTHKPAPTAHSSFQHEALFYRGTQDFLDQTVPFVLEGVALGQPVMVALAGSRLETLRTALDTDSDLIQLVDMAEFGRNPARIISGWQGFIEGYEAGQPMRGVGEPVWAGRRPDEVVECQLHEALVNLVVPPDAPIWLRCPYDVDALDGSVVEEATRSHPALVEAGGYRGSTRYGGAHHAEVGFAGELPTPPETARSVNVGRDDVATVRLLVTRAAADAGLDASRGRDLGAAMAAVAATSLQHGGGSSRLRVWQRPDALVCEVSDSSPTADPLVGRRTHPSRRERGHGVWLANQLCDLVQTRSSAAGTTVRVLSWK